MLHSNVSQQTSESDRRDTTQPQNRILGAVIQCSGSRARVSADISASQFSDDWVVSSFITLVGPRSRIVGMLVHLDLPNGIWEAEGSNRVYFDLELVGEVIDTPDGPKFSRGISTYPSIGALAHRIRAKDLESIFHNKGNNTVKVGTLSQNSELDATISIDEMLAKHFAVVGSTGVGKSSAVSLLLHKAVALRKKLRIMVLDPHNEYANAFDELGHTLTAETMKLPYWLFRLEEFTEVLFRGREHGTDEIDILRQLIPLAKSQYRTTDSRIGLRKSVDIGNITADTPIPYRIEDLSRLIDDRMGQLDNKVERPALRLLKSRIQTVITDPRFSFMFGFKRIQDTFAEVMRELYRVPVNGKPITIVQLAGLPSEVVNSVASVLSRLAFDMATLSQGTYEILVVAEEAHRYLPADPKMGFEPTRLALAKIAKEGRKYGCFLACITQRPGELDPTILSQCSTIFAMRLANEADQAIIGSAIGDSSSSNLSFLPTMAQREAIVFGEGVSTPMRLRFEQLEDRFLPKLTNEAENTNAINGQVELTRIIARMRAGIGELEDDDDMMLEQPQTTSARIRPTPDTEQEIDAITGRPVLRRVTDPYVSGHTKTTDPHRLGRRLNDPVFRPMSEDQD